MAKFEREAIVVDARERFAVQWEKLRDFTRKLLRSEVEFTDADEQQLFDEMSQHFQLSEESVRRVATICELQIQEELQNA